MTAPTSVATDISRLDGALARIDLLETRSASFTESVHTAVGTMMPKAEALLSGRKSEEDFTSSGSSLPIDPAPSSSLLEMAERGDGEGILRILSERHTDIGDLQRTENGDTALHVAASRGHLKAVMALLGVGAKVDTVGHRLRTPLHCAAAHGHLQVAQRLLDAGAQIDAKDASGATALELAVKEGHCSVVELFLEQKVSPDPCNEEGDTLLVQAAKVGRWDMVKLLLKRGASATKSKKASECALRYAAEGGHADAVRLILRHGAALVSAQLNWGLWKATSAAVVGAFVDVVPHPVRGEAGGWGLRGTAHFARHEPMVALLDAGVNVEARDKNSKTALWLAAANGSIACLRKLLQRGAHIQAKCSAGNSPLHAACMFDKAECVRALLAAGASTIEKNSAGKTPLKVATSEAVRQLFNATSDQ